MCHEYGVIEGDQQGFCISSCTGTDPRLKLQLIFCKFLIVVRPLLSKWSRYSFCKFNRVGLRSMEDVRGKRDSIEQNQSRHRDHSMMQHDVASRWDHEDCRGGDDLYLWCEFGSSSSRRKVKSGRTGCWPLLYQSVLCSISRSHSCSLQGPETSRKGTFIFTL